MAIPRGKHTKGKKHDVRMHHFIKGTSLVPCPKCGVLKKPHFVCDSCGYYKKEEVVNVLEKLNKKEKKRKEKEMAAKEKEEAKKPPIEDKK